MDKQTLESIAEMICGEPGPVYRTGTGLTRFFQRVGFSNFIHDGSTRKWWTLSVLESLTERNLQAVILRLANPREYKGEKDTVQSAVFQLNNMLSIEGIKIEIEGISSKLIIIDPYLAESERELKPLEPPKFNDLPVNIPFS